ncbi:MAG TPA: alpha/beta hydrolase [Euzebyales bacterium]|nr:alpha/beta hydrolase [Euzebyales bacterium]
MTAATDARISVRQDLQLAVRRWVGATSPSFVLVHGLASNARMWDGVAARLCDAGHAVVALDQRGHGRSYAPNAGYDFATVTDDLRLLVDALGLVRPVLVGQSWGGNVVLEAAARWGDWLAGIAAVDGGTIDLQQRFPTWEACAAQLAPPVFDGITRPELERRVRRMHPDWPDDGIAGILANLAELPDGSLRPHLRRDLHMQILRALWEHEPTKRYRAIDAPVLLIPADAGDAARTSTTRHDVGVAADLLPRSRVRWLVGDHDLHAQQPDAVARLLLDAVGDGFFR